MGKGPIIVTLVFCVTFNILLYDIDGLTSCALASLSSTGQELNDSISGDAKNLTNSSDIALTLAEIINKSAVLTSGSKNETAATTVNFTGEASPEGNVTVATVSTQQPGLAGAELISSLIIAIAIFIVVPLLFGMYLTYRQGLQTTTQGKNVFRFGMQNLYRLLVAIGVIFTVILIIVYLNALIALHSYTQGSVVASLLETQKNFLTIIGTAFASLVAFYFGTRGTNNSRAERPAAITSREITKKDLEVINVNPIDGTVGVEVDSPVTVAFSAPVRSSTINSNTFSVKDASGNPVQGKISLTDNNTTIRFDPMPLFNRNSKYTVVIAKGIINVAGDSLAADVEWHFATIA